MEESSRDGCYNGQGEGAVGGAHDFVNAERACLLIELEPVLILLEPETEREDCPQLERMINATMVLLNKVLGVLNVDDARIVQRALFDKAREARRKNRPEKLPYWDAESHLGFVEEPLGKTVFKSVFENGLEFAATHLEVWRD